MADGLTPSTIDIPLGNVGQQTPDHAGPLGRLVSIVNAEIVQYVPPSPGSPPRNTARQRPGFASLPSEIRSLDDGATLIDDDFHTPQLLASIGDQLVSIAHSVPRVYNGLSSWTQHDSIVATQNLSEEIIHTTNRVVQAPDSAWLQGIECTVWNETNANGTVSSLVGFRAENGAQIVKPRVLFTTAGGNDNTIIRVCASNSTYQVFFVVTRDSNVLTNLKIRAYDVHGIELGAASFLMEWLVTPGFWDLTDCSQTVGGVGYTAAVIQPGGFSTSDTNVGNVINYFNWDGSTINTTTVTYSTSQTNCGGRCAWSTKKRGLAANTLYFSTVAGGGSGGNDSLRTYEVTDGALTHTYSTGGVTVPHAFVDGLTGYAQSDGTTVYVGITVSLLALGPQSVGPPSDPGLRAVVVWQVQRNGTVTFVTQHNGVLLQTRAFELDDHWHAVTYYQGGSGIARSTAGAAVSWTSGDYMTGASEQPIPVTSGDLVTGSPNIVPNTEGVLNPSQAIASITHNAGDGVVAGTAVWTLLNASFTDITYGVSARNSYLVVSGATPAALNDSWRIISVTDATHVVTENVGLNGNTLQNSTLAGATISLQSTTAISVYANGSDGVYVPPAVASEYVGGSVVVQNAAHAANNATYTIRRILYNDTLQGFASSRLYTTYLCVTPGSQVWEQMPATAVTTIGPATPSRTWKMALGRFSSLDVGMALLAQGVGSGDDGPHDITSVTSATRAVTANDTLYPASLPTSATLQVIAPAGTELKLRLQSVAFNDSYLGALVTISGANDGANDGTYTIKSVIASDTVTIASATGAVGQRNELFSNTVGIKIFKLAVVQDALQPTWFVSPLSLNQQTVGRFDSGVAYADWRYDGDTVPNVFLLGLSTPFFVPQTNQIRFTLPYRAESFTANQSLVGGAGVNVSRAALEATIGLKDFTIDPTCGEAHVMGETMLLPGLQGAQYNVSGFSEQGVALFFEQPFIISQSNDPSVVGITPLSRRQYVVVAELTDENGNRVFSIPSPPLDVQLTGNNNVVTLGGRLIGPTNRNVAISIYCTAWNSGIQTTEHYKITNDLDINGAGFTLSTAGYSYGALKDTWQFVDKNADSEIQDHEELYTDKGYLPRYPAPAFSKAATWKNRVWLLCSDGTIRPSGDRTPGDAPWWHPGLKITIPTTDRPVAVQPMDTYLLVICESSYWYIPDADLPDNTGQNGALPEPVQIQFQGTADGFSVASKNGVLYNNPDSNGAWLITRGLTNEWLSEDIRAELTGASGVTGMAIDGQQRLYISVADADGNRLHVYDGISKTWWRWNMPSAPRLLTTYRGKPVYQDDLFIMAQSPARFDSRNGVITGCPPSYEFATFNFAGVRSFKRLWAEQIVGKFKGDHTLHAQITYPDEVGLDPTEFEFVPDRDDDYVYEINPLNEEASTYGLKVWVTFDGVDDPGDSFEFEMVSCEVGLERGINRVPDSKRKAAK